MSKHNKSQREQGRKPWVVCENCGRGLVWKRADFSSMLEAHRFIGQHYELDEIEELAVDVLYELADGTLTTEY